MTSVTSIDMTPKQKAEQLMESFYNTSISTVPPTKTEVKAMAIIVVEEVLAVMYSYHIFAVNYWNEVKEEIEEL